MCTYEDLVGSIFENPRSGQLDQFEVFAGEEGQLIMESLFKTEDEAPPFGGVLNFALKTDRSAARVNQLGLEGARVGSKKQVWEMPFERFCFRIRKESQEWRETMLVSVFLARLGVHEPLLVAGNTDYDDGASVSLMTQLCFRYGCFDATRNYVDNNFYTYAATEERAPYAAPGKLQAAVLYACASCLRSTVRAACCAAQGQQRHVSRSCVGRLAAGRRGAEKRLCAHAAFCRIALDTTMPFDVDVLPTALAEWIVLSLFVVNMSLYFFVAEYEGQVKNIPIELQRLGKEAFERTFAVVRDGLAPKHLASKALLEQLANVDTNTVAVLETGREEAGEAVGFAEKPLGKREPPPKFKQEPPATEKPEPAQQPEPAKPAPPAMAPPGKGAVPPPPKPPPPPPATGPAKKPSTEQTIKDFELKFKRVRAEIDALNKTRTWLNNKASLLEAAINSFIMIYNRKREKVLESEQNLEIARGELSQIPPKKSKPAVEELEENFEKKLKKLRNRYAEIDESRNQLDTIVLLYNTYGERVKTLEDSNIKSIQRKLTLLYQKLGQPLSPDSEYFIEIKNSGSNLLPKPTDEGKAEEKEAPSRDNLVASIQARKGSESVVPDEYLNPRLLSLNARQFLKDRDGKLTENLPVYEERGALTAQRGKKYASLLLKQFGSPDDPENPESGESKKASIEDVEAYRVLVKMSELQASFNKKQTAAGRAEVQEQMEELQSSYDAAVAYLGTLGKEETAFIKSMKLLVEFAALEDILAKVQEESNKGVENFKQYEALLENSDSLVLWKNCKRTW